MSEKRVFNLVTSITYEKLDLNTLQAGELVEQDIALYLERNDKYVVVAPALQPLDAQVLVRLKKSGTAWVKKPSMEQTYPELQSTVDVIRGVLSNDKLAPFESVRNVRNGVAWIWPTLKDGSQDSAQNFNAPVILMKRLFAVPSPVVMQHLSEKSQQVCVHSLRVSCMAGVMALYLGYLSEEIIKNYVSTVFLAEIGVFAEEQVSQGLVDAILGQQQSLSESEKKLYDLRAQNTIKLLTAASLTGVASPDERLKIIINGFCIRKTAYHMSKLRSLIKQLQQLPLTVQTRSLSFL